MGLLLRRLLVSARPHVGHVAIRPDDLLGRFASVSGVGTEVLFGQFPIFVRPWAEDTGVEQRWQLADIVPMGAGHDERQRDATGVYLQMSFASFFFPRSVGLGPTAS